MTGTTGSPPQSAEDPLCLCAVYHMLRLTSSQAGPSADAQTNGSAVFFLLTKLKTKIIVIVIITIIRDQYMEQKDVAVLD